MDLELGPVLITGASGFVGANLAHRLVAEGESVHVLLRSASDTGRIDGLQLTRHFGDLLDRAALDKILGQVRPKVVMHCATYGGHVFQADPHRILEVNLMGTINLLEAALHAGTGSFLNSGSSSEYGRKAGPMSESDPLEPETTYGAAKAAATMATQAFGLAGSMAVVTIRPFSPFGPLDSPARLIPTVIDSCLAGRNPELSSPQNVRDFVYIDDVVDLYLSAARSPAHGEVINCGYGVQRTVAEVARTIIALTGAAVRPAWRSVDQRPYVADCWLADTRKAAGLYDWKPRFTFEEGVERTISWHRSQMTR